MNFQEKKRRWIAEALAEKAVAGTSMSSPGAKRRRSMGTWNESNISSFEENDDETERQVRRQSAVFRSSSGQSTVLSSPDISGIDLNNEVANCIKLSATHKINTKNAFQIKIIDSLFYTLKKKDDLNLSNFQLAGVGLEISTMIYGYRVDKVHADLLKAVSGHSESEDRQNQLIEACDEVDACKVILQKQKIGRKKRTKFLMEVNSLMGFVETCNPSSLKNCEQQEVFTSDLLLQATFAPYSVDDVYLYHAPGEDSNVENKIYQIPCVENFSKNRLCPDFSNFTFLNQNQSGSEKDQDTGKDEGEYQFDLDATAYEPRQCPIASVDDLEIFEEKCERQDQSRRVEWITDFLDAIVNNTDPNVTYEYGYHPRNCRITFKRPFFWKVRFDCNPESESKKLNKQTRNRKKIIFSYEEIDKMSYEERFSRINRNTKLRDETTQDWTEDKLVGGNVILFSSENFDAFFCTSQKFIARRRIRSEELDEFYESRLDANNDDYSSEEHSTNIPDFYQEEAGYQLYSENQEAVVGDNLVSAPTLVPESLIAYRQQAKKINMKQLKKIMWRELRSSLLNSSSNSESEDKYFSDIYVAVTSKLQELEDAQNLSPGIAFVSLLSLANEKNLVVEKVDDLSDGIIKNVIREDLDYI